MEPLNTLTQLYFGYFGRAPEPIGYDFWESVIDGGLSLQAIAEDFATQPEALALYPELAEGTGADFTAFVTSIYANLFNRTPDQAGLEFWVGALQDGFSIGAAILAIIEGAIGDDVTTLENKVNLSNEWLGLARVEPGFELTDDAKDASRAALEFIGENPGEPEQAQVLVEAFFNDAPEITLNRVLSSLGADTDTRERAKLADVVISDDGLGTNRLTLSGDSGTLFELDGDELFLTADADLSSVSGMSLSVALAVDDITLGMGPEDTAFYGIFIEPAAEPLEPNVPITPPDDGTGTVGGGRG